MRSNFKRFLNDIHGTKEIIRIDLFISFKIKTKKDGCHCTKASQSIDTKDLA